MQFDIFQALGTDYAQQKQLERLIESKPNIFVGWIDSFDETNGTANIQPAIQDKIIDSNNLVQYKNKPYLINVWVCGNTLTRKPQKGDKALVFVLDEKSNNFFKATFDNTKNIKDQTFTNNSKTNRNISNTVAIVINSSNVEKTTIVDNLTSTSATYALSANQGRILNETKANKTDVQNDFTKQGLADINNCSTYDQIYTVLANSQNGTGVGDIGYASQSPIRTLLPTIPFVENFVKVYAKIIAGTDANFWAIELYTIANLYNNGQTIPVYKMQIGRNIVGGNAQYRVSPWYNPATTILSANLGQNGYIKYTNGLIIQWGRFTSRGRGIQVTFPIAFTSSVFAIAGSNIAATNTNTTSTIKASNVTTASATFYAPYRGSGSSAGFTDSTSETFTWIAIGE